MKEIINRRFDSAFGYFGVLKADWVEEQIDDGCCDQDLIQNDLNRIYPNNKYFVLLDFIDNRQDGYFWLRIWEK